MKLKNNPSLIIIILLIISSTNLVAQHDTHLPASHHGKHHIAVFNGVTYNQLHKESSYTIGLDYEYRLRGFIGVGLFSEYIFVGPDEIIAGIPFTIHPHKSAKVILAPMLVFAKYHSEFEPETGYESNFAFRVGAGYDFHIERLSVGPTINYDFGESNALNYGISIGFGF